MDTAVAPAPGAPSTTSSPAEPRRADDGRTAALLVALLAWTIPLATGYAVWSAPGGEGDWLRSVMVAPFDIVLVLAAAWVAVRPDLLQDLFRSRAVRVVGSLYALMAVVSFVAHPGPLGVAQLLRLAAGLAVIAITVRATADPAGRTLALGALTAAGVAQAALGMVQAARGAAFGVELLDFTGPLYPFGTSLAGRGGLTHPYHLAVLLIVAQGAALLGLRHAHDRVRWAWLGALAVLGAGLAVTYTRAGLIGQLGLLACLLLARADRRRTLLAAGVIALGLLVGATAFGDGWIAKGEATAGANGASADSNRGQRLREAEELTRAQPIVGVGIGRYVETLAQTPRTEYLPAHDLVAQEAAELGLAGGALAVALLALLGLRVLRGGAWTGAVVAPMVPFLLLDAYPYVFATGLALSALWLGLVRASLTAAEETR